jgi:hypothetical protein
VAAVRRVVFGASEAAMSARRRGRLAPPGGPSAGLGLLVDEVLGRAVRHESAAAVMWWWGASETAVYHWRKALGVGRMDSEGSRRLIQAEAGAAAMREHEFTDEECDQRSRQSLALGLGRYLKTG